MRYIISCRFHDIESSKVKIVIECADPIREIAVKVIRSEVGTSRRNGWITKGDSCIGWVVGIGSVIININLIEISIIERVCCINCQ